MQKLQDIQLSEAFVSGTTGQAIPVSIQLIPDGFSEKDIKISSDNPDVATYNNGQVLIHGPGETDIHFISNETSMERTLHVSGSTSFTARSWSDLPVQVGIGLCLFMFVMRVVFGFNVPFIGFVGAGLCVLSLFVDRESRVSAAIFTVLNLLIARINLLNTYVDYMQARLNRQPAPSELQKIVNVIVWNFWQMDGFTCTIPYAEPEKEEMDQTAFEGFFDAVIEEPKNIQPVCLIRDWRETGEGGKAHKFTELKD